MIKSLILAVALALFVTLVAWFIIPDSTYVEHALGILIATFATTIFATIGVFFYVNKAEAA